MAKQKYYGVRAGRAPGVYRTWAECQKQVQGYPGAVFKGFFSPAEAEAFVAGSAPAAAETRAAAGGAGEKHGYDVYVDGSYIHGRYGWGFAVYDGEEVIHTDQGVGDNPSAAAMHNVAGELAATMRAVLWARQQGAEAITIHHDYMGIAAWATGDWKAKNEHTQAYAAFIRPHLSWVRFNKVAGHTGVAGNELADKLAGGALGKK